MTNKMAKEISSVVSIVKMKLSHRNILLDQFQKLLVVATVKIPEEVSAKYLREYGTSTVQADVQVEAHGNTGEVELQATVSVKLTYKGDMVMSSPDIRDKIRYRLHKLALQCCANEALESIINASQK